MTPSKMNRLCCPACSHIPPPVVETLKAKRKEYIDERSFFLRHNKRFVWTLFVSVFVLPMVLVFREAPDSFFVAALFIWFASTTSLLLSIGIRGAQLQKRFASDHPEEAEALKIAGE